jgi:putative transposase
VNRIKDPIVQFNKSDSSVFNAFLSFSTYGEGRLEIPTKYDCRYHGSILDYQKGYNTSYTMVFKNDKPHHVALTKKVDVEVHTEKTNYMAVDTNVKNNLFALSNGETIDYERDMFDDYVKFLKKMEAKIVRKKKRNGNKTQPLSKRDTRMQKNWQVRIRDMLKRCCNILINKMMDNKKDHLVVEDLGQFAKSFARSDEFDGIKYGRLIMLLNLSDLKNILQSMCDKKGLQITFVQVHYTSQTCSRCGYIDRENRKTQENFVCQECGFEINADLNAALNILFRLTSDVLRSSLLLENEFGFSPRRLKKEEIKKFIEDAHSGLVKKQKCEYNIVTSLCKAA